MKKIILLSFIVPLLLLTGCQTKQDSSNNANVNISRTGSTNTNNEQNSSNEASNRSKESNENSNTSRESGAAVNNDVSANTENPQPSDTQNNSQENKTPTETPLYSFSTQIKTSSENRLNNIQLACSELNNATVNNGEEFSFYGVVGPASQNEGYKKADVIVNKKVIQATGGGMCQVSSTLYNVVLGIPGLQVTERHEHQKPVNYVEKGKDAAVSYGSQDFKFINNTGKTIKIHANADDGNVNVDIVSVE